MSASSQPPDDKGGVPKRSLTEQQIRALEHLRKKLREVSGTQEAIVGVAKIIGDMPSLSNEVCQILAEEHAHSRHINHKLSIFYVFNEIVQRGRTGNQKLLQAGAEKFLNPNMCNFVATLSPHDKKPYMRTLDIWLKRRVYSAKYLTGLRESWGRQLKPATNSVSKRRRPGDDRNGSPEASHKLKHVVDEEKLKTMRVVLAPPPPPRHPLKDSFEKALTEVSTPSREGTTTRNSGASTTVKWYMQSHGIVGPDSLWKAMCSEPTARELRQCCSREIEESDREAQRITRLIMQLSKLWGEQRDLLLKCRERG
ncbi:hypothetical protein FOL47_005445 [Perkinsus chesapeaki]|uniref:CID domain-containing protein n=1 Tax=Perkinsus chesapeaki TaxID=330153 RepID=A0A7J6MYL6_PERCH|nr:hypothetical protein FOL47_005445 [Perkinsus chesapeaki]